MKRLILYIYFFSFVSCTQLFLGDDPSNTGVAIFDEFWKGVDMNWPEFETKKVNWDSLYTVYRPRVDAATNDRDLLAVLKGLLYNLKDGHTDIWTTNHSLSADYHPAYPFNFYGIRWIQQHYVSNLKGTSAVSYGFIAQDVGYVYVSTFFNSEDQYSIMDDILKAFGGVKGIIIDVRHNGGGSTKNAAAIASRFADKNRTYDFIRFRTGKQRNMMGDFIAENIGPAGPVQFKGKVAVLTNRYSFSATENFIFMMKAFPQVLQIGDNTFGGSGSAPIFKELPRGWFCRLSTSLVCDLNKQPIGKGIVPDILVQTTKADSLLGKDTILDRAIFEVKK